MLRRVYSSYRRVWHTKNTLTRHMHVSKNLNGRLIFWHLRGETHLPLCPKGVQRLQCMRQTPGAGLGGYGRIISQSVVSV